MVAEKSEGEQEFVDMMTNIRRKVAERYGIPASVVPAVIVHAYLPREFGRYFPKDYCRRVNATT